MAFFGAAKDVLPGRWLHICTTERTYTCHVFAAHNACPHLVALLSAEEAEELFTLNTLQNSENVNTLGNEEKVLLLKRQRRLRDSPANEPTALCCSEVQKMMNAKSSASATVLPRGREALEIQIAASAKNITRGSKEVANTTQLQMIAADLAAVEEEVQASKATFTKPAVAKQKSSTKKLSRNATDRNHKALEPQRAATKTTGVRSSARVAVVATQDAYMEVIEPRNRGQQ